MWWLSHCLSPISERRASRKLTYPICCGVDVHKTFLVATTITSESVMPHYHQKRFSAFYSDPVAFKKLLFENNCKDVCMESTGKYWVPVWNVLEDSVHVLPKRAGTGSNMKGIAAGERQDASPVTSILQPPKEVNTDFQACHKLCFYDAKRRMFGIRSAVAPPLDDRKPPTLMENQGRGINAAIFTAAYRRGTVQK